MYFEGEGTVAQQVQASPKSALVEASSGSGSETGMTAAAVKPAKQTEDMSIMAGSRGNHTSLPTLPPFAGEESKDDGESFDQWIHQLERHAELERWSDRKKTCAAGVEVEGASGAVV